MKLQQQALDWWNTKTTEQQIYLREIVFKRNIEVKDIVIMYQLRETMADMTDMTIDAERKFTAFLNKNDKRVDSFVLLTNNKEVLLAYEKLITKK